IGIKYLAPKLVANKPVAPFSQFKLTRLTSAGNASAAAISPDGKYVAHVKGTPEQESLWLRHIGTGSDTEIVSSDGSQIYGLSFSPDGDHVYFVREQGEVLSEVPVLGGTPRALIQDVDTAITFSPDGKRFAFIRGDPSMAKASLIIANADGSEEHKVV